jgi:hypothetical protein
MSHVRTANGAVFTDSTLHPDDTTDLVNAASVLPGLETPLDNSKFLHLQDWPLLTVAQLAAIAAPINGLVRTVKDASDRKIGRFQFRTGATPDAGAVSGGSYVAAADASGVWFSEAYAGLAVGGTNAITNAARQLIMPGDTPVFQTPRRVRVAVPLSMLMDVFPSSGPGAYGIDGTNYRFTGDAGPLDGNFALNGVQAISLFAMVQGFYFRTRLPRGSFAGASIVIDPNGTGNIADSGNVSRRLEVKVWEMPSNYSVSATDVTTYPSANMHFGATAMAPKWVGYCGTVGQLIPSGAAPDPNGTRTFFARHPAMVHMLSGTFGFGMAGTGGDAAFNTSEEQEYLIGVLPPFSVGAGWVSVVGSTESILYKLEVWVDVTNMGAA